MCYKRNLHRNNDCDLPITVYSWLQHPCSVTVMSVVVRHTNEARRLSSFRGLAAPLTMMYNGLARYRGVAMSVTWIRHRLRLRRRALGKRLFHVGFHRQMRNLLDTVLQSKLMSFMCILYMAVAEYRVPIYCMSPVAQILGGGLEPLGPHTFGAYGRGGRNPSVGSGGRSSGIEVWGEFTHKLGNFYTWNVNIFTSHERKKWANQKNNRMRVNSTRSNAEKHYIIPIDADA